jgi:hypothetical protein
MYCSDYHSAPVKLVVDSSSAQKLSEASMTTSDRSVIRVNMEKLKDLSKNTRSYVVNFLYTTLVLWHLIK